MVRSVADPFHDVCPIAGIEAVAKSFRQRLGVDHDGIVGVISVNGNFDVVEDDRMVRHAERRSSRILFYLGQHFSVCQIKLLDSRDMRGICCAINLLEIWIARMRSGHF